ncbi:MAG: VOC family protein [Planctomycetota bacterium]|jgi:catechol 2,3-dioxygenase-like lactoylglutathione lyase family enzyme
MAVYLEHANITVPDVDAAIAFLRTIDPALRVRHDETPPNSHRWVHIGTDDTYIALQAPHLDANPLALRQAYENYGVNHLGWVVDDFDAAIARLEKGGYRRGMEVEPHPHRRRAYYFDTADFEWEIVEYSSDDPAARNAYD